MTIEAPYATPFMDTAVFRRTQLGQAELVTKATILSRSQWRFLAVVNGFTPLRPLADLIGESADINAFVSELYDKALIELVSESETAAVSA